MNKILKNQLVTTFNQLIADLKTSKEAEEFLSGFLTPYEYDLLVKRLAVGYWLKKGRSYANIKQNLKPSTATIAATKKLMENKGFKMGLAKVEADEWANVWSEKIKKIVSAK